MEEKQIGRWRKGEPVLDEIIIKATGRSTWNKSFLHDVRYVVHDHGLTGKRKDPIEVVVLCDRSQAGGTAIDVVIKPYKYYRYRRRTQAQETLDAIIAADKRYAETGGGILYKTKPLHQNSELIEKLRDLLVRIEPH